MRKISTLVSRKVASLCVVLCAAAITTAQTGVSFRKAAPQAVDRGELKVQPGASPISATIALRLPGLAHAEDLLKSLYTPGDPQFHRFLKADEFVSRFAPKAADVAKVSTALANYGLAVERTSATTLRVTGMPADMERAFAVNLHSYSVAGRGTVKGHTYHAPLDHPTVPAEISASVAAVVGLDSRPRFRAHSHQAPRAVAQARSKAQSATALSGAAIGNEPGFWTVKDFARYYNVRPLYKRGISGRGQTIGILTLASFTPQRCIRLLGRLGP